MSQTFDPYHKWLGIPPGEQPPNHYRLLGISLFESDPDVIEAAADQRMAHVRTHQWGGRAALGQSLLNEISSAKICLLAPERKAEYDAWLMSMQRSTGQYQPPMGTALPVATPLPVARPVPVSSPSDTPVVQTGSTESSAPQTPTTATEVSDEPIICERRSSSVSRHVHRRKPADQVWVTIGAVAAVAATLVIVLWLSGVGKIDQQDDGSRMATKPVVERPIAGSPRASPISMDDRPGKVRSETPLPVQPASPDAVEESTVLERAKLPVPDKAILADVTERLHVERKDWPPRQLISEAKVSPTPEETYALLCLARASATTAGDVRTALMSVEVINERFVVDALDRKADVLWEVEEYASGKGDFREIAGSAFVLVDQALEATRYDIARKCVDAALLAARKAGDDDLIDRATARVLELRKTRSDTKSTEETKGPAAPAASDLRTPQGAFSLVRTGSPFLLLLAQRTVASPTK
jgi:hypothetical protein